MTILLPLRSGTSGPLFVGENDQDTLLWNATEQRWTVGPGGGGGAVDSVFGRVGVVVAATGDYDGDQVDNVSSVPGASLSDALEYLLANAGAVASVFGRTGVVAAASGDYDSDQVDNASTVDGATVSDALEALEAQNVALGPALLGGANITGNVSLTVAGGTHYNIPGPLVANITVTLGVGGPPRDNQSIVIDRQDNSAFTVTIVNGGPLAGTLLTMPVSRRMGAAFSYAAGDFYPGGNYDLAAP